MISASKEELQQQLESTLVKPDCHSWRISKMQSDTFEEWYAIKFCFKLGKKARETYAMLQTVCRSSCMNQSGFWVAWIKQVFEWHESIRFLSGIRNSRKAGILWGMMRGVRGVRRSIHRSWLAKGLGLCSDYLSKMGIKTVSQPPYSPDIAPSDFCFFPKLRGCRYEEKKEVMTKVIDTVTQEDHHGAFQKLMERYNKCIAAGADLFERD